MYLLNLSNYLAASKVHPEAAHTKRLFQVSKASTELYKESVETLKVLKALKTPPSMPSEKKSMLVPSNLPFLQLASDSVLAKPHRDVFDSVYDFCHEFTTVLEAHSLSLDDCWERLLPMCLNKEERSWFEDKLKNKTYNSKEAESILLDHCDTPFRRFLNMGRVWCMKQEKGESVRSFGATFQKYRKQTDLECFKCTRIT